jgi:hypothetical protein
MSASIRRFLNQNVPRLRRPNTGQAPNGASIVRAKFLLELSIFTMFGSVLTTCFFELEPARPNGHEMSLPRPSGYAKKAAVDASYPSSYRPSGKVLFTMSRTLWVTFTRKKLNA